MREHQAHEFFAGITGCSKMPIFTFLPIGQCSFVVRCWLGLPLGFEAEEAGPGAHGLLLPRADLERRHAGQKQKILLSEKVVGGMIPFACPITHE